MIEPVGILPGNLALCVAVGALYAVGVYLILQRTLTRVVIGIGLLGHGANLLLLLSGGPRGRAPFATPDTEPGAGVAIGDTADPLPQAMALTAVVITFALTAFLLALAYRSYVLTSDDEVQDDVEDRRIAAGAADQRALDDALIGSDEESVDSEGSDSSAGSAGSARSPGSRRLT